MPSEATAVGCRKVFEVAAMFVVVVLKSGWPRTTVACPTHTGHPVLYGRSAVGGGSIPERFWNNRMRLFSGDAAMRLSSATNKVLAAYATPPAAPMIVSLEFGSAFANVGCPITARAACPVVKSAAHAAAAHKRIVGMHFMRNVNGRGP